MKKHTTKLAANPFVTEYTTKNTAANNNIYMGDVLVNSTGK